MTDCNNANGTFRRRPPRKMISLVSSSALPSYHLPPDFARHKISRPIASSRIRENHPCDVSLSINGMKPRPYCYERGPIGSPVFGAQLQCRLCRVLVKVLLQVRATQQ